MNKKSSPNQRKNKAQLRANNKKFPSKRIASSLGQSEESMQIAKRPITTERATFRPIEKEKMLPPVKNWKLWGWYSLVFFLGATLLTSIFGFIYILLILKDLPDPEALTNINIVSTTKILARDGTLLYEAGDDGARRTVVGLDQISKHMINATLAAEDDQFYNHPGFDWQGIARALYQDSINVLTGNRARQGGSTITQQLVKLSFLTPEKTLKRKVSELILSLELEQHYSKDQILEMYLNKIFYGYQSYGIEAAAHTYFNKPAKTLTIAESATLAAIPQSPTRYSPYNNKETLMNRQKVILNRMHNLGLLNDAEFTKASNDEINFQPVRATIRAPHFVFYILQELEKTYGEQIRGLNVYTSLDINLQDQAEKVVREGALKNEKSHGAKNAGLISIDPKTGEILAMVGSRDYFDDTVDGQVNVITSKRQPGSTFKPFTYATLFTKGFGTGTVFFDVKTDFGNKYTPLDYDGKFRGPVTVRNALSNSLNIPAVAAQYLANTEDTLTLLNKMGIDYLNKDLAAKNGLALALGVEEITPLDMVKAYSVFANNGVKRDIGGIMRITTDRGGEIWKRTVTTGEEVLDPQAAYLISNILSDNNARPSGWTNLVIPNQTVAVKTGTSINIVNNVKKPKDLWTIGYTPSIVTAVWVGNNQGDIPTLTADGITNAASIWKAFMIKALDKKPREEFARPEKIKEISISTLSGLLPSSTTPSDKVRTELFPDYGVPQLVEQGFQSAKVDQISGKLATESCPTNTALYVYQNYHSILYYLRPNDPALKRWEDGVQAWAQGNKTITTTDPNKPATTPTSSDGIPIIYVDDPAKIPTEPCNIIPPSEVGIELIKPGEGDKIANGPNQALFSYRDPASISKVGIYFDEKLVGTGDTGRLDSLNFNVPISTLGSVHTIRFVFTMIDGSQSFMQIGVVVSDDVSGPGVTLQAPTEHQVVHTGETFQISASVIDNKQVTKVEFFFDGTPIITLENSPYITSYYIAQDVVPGQHELLLRAYDDSGNVTRVKRTIDVVRSAVTERSTSSSAPSTSPTPVPLFTLPPTSEVLL